MKLVIGGYAQGKLNYVLQQNGGKQFCVWDGVLLDSDGACLDETDLDGVCQNGAYSGETGLDGTRQDDADTGEKGKTVIFNHFHNWVRECILQGRNPEKEIQAMLCRYPDCIIISDEIGNGIVPVDAFEREYRERTGRLLVELAGAAEEVVRVICGIGQKIK